MNNDLLNEMWSAYTFLNDKLQWIGDCHILVARNLHISAEEHKNKIFIHIQPLRGRNSNETWFGIYFGFISITAAVAGFLIEQMGCNCTDSNRNEIMRKCTSTHVNRNAIENVESDPNHLHPGKRGYHGWCLHSTKSTSNNEINCVWLTSNM